MQIAILCGEASGDRVGGQLAGEIRRLEPNAVLWGTGGKHVRAAGVEVVAETTRLGVVGIAAAAKIVPRLLLLQAQLRRTLRARRPDVLVLVDAGAFNVPLGRWTRAHVPGTRILYYFPPGSWRRTLKGSGLQFADAVATPFPWSESELRRLGVNARFVGHSLLDLVQPAQPPEVFAARHNLDRERPTVGILPGSRAQEIKAILPVQLEAAAIVHKRVPGVQFLLGLAPTVDRADIVRAIEDLRRRHVHLRDLLRRMEERLKDEIAGRPLRPLVTSEGTLVPPRDLLLHEKSAAWRAQLEDKHGRADFALTIVENATYDMMAASDVLLCASGTATLEAAILNKPMVILYRMSRWNLLEYHLVKKTLPPFVGLPNLLAQKRVCPEFLQDDATPEALSGVLIDLLLQPERMLRMKQDLKETVALLGEPGGAARAAQMVVELARQPPDPDVAG